MPLRSRQHHGRKQGQEGIENPSSSYLMQLPPDLFRCVLEQVASPDLVADRTRAMAGHLARVTRVCKQFRDHTEPYLYQKIYTRIDSPNNTTWLADLLQRRPEVASWIRVLILDEFEPYQLRNMLFCEMPFLGHLLFQHEGNSTREYSSRTIRLLNRSVCQQPALEDSKHELFLRTVIIEVCSLLLFRMSLRTI